MDKKSAPVRIDIVGDLNIFNAAEQRQRLLDAFGAGSEVEVDLSCVTEIDSAGVQLMLAAKREATAQDKPLRFIGHSPAVSEVLELCDLSGHLGDPAVIRART